MSKEKLAIEGGKKAVAQLGPYPTKIGREELLELLDLWEFTPEAGRQIKALIQADEGLRGPHLFRYYNPRPSKVEAAEGAMKELIGVKHCLGVNSCTSALICAYRALGIGAGDEVIVPGYTFFATAATVATCNAVPVIVDVDDSLNIDPEAAEGAITRRTRAIAAVHMLGAPAQMDAIMDLADRKGLPVVEDAAQSAGGLFQGRALGSIGTLGCFSFDYYKIIVSGEGGFLTTDDEWLCTRAQSWHDTAACWRPDRYDRERRDGELFCGENYRMSELQGAVALSQIRKAGQILEGYRRAKGRIKGQIESVPGLSFRRIVDDAGDTGLCLVMFLPDADITKKALDALKAEGVPAGGIYDKTVRDWHIYTYWEHILGTKAVARDGLPWSAIPEGEEPRYAPDMCPRTLDLLGRAVMIDVDPNWTDKECDMIARGVNKVVRAHLDA